MLLLRAWLSRQVVPPGPRATLRPAPDIAAPTLRVRGLLPRRRGAVRRRGPKRATLGTPNSIPAYRFTATYFVSTYSSIPS